MTTLQLLTSGWDWEPSIVAGSLGLLLVYGWAVQWRFTPRAISYFTGVCLMFLVLVSPLDELGDTYLLSAHMIQHLFLALLIPPLLLLGLPESIAQRVINVPLFARIERIVGSPLVAWTAGISAMAVWHMPPLFNAALQNQPVHICQHLCFLVSGTIFWWPVLSPLQRSRMAPVPWAAAYLFAACLACTIIGVLITFSPASIYPAYLHPSGSPEMLALIRNEWGLSADADHQWGGLLMWTVGCTEYLCATMAMFARWYALPDNPPFPVLST